jgi:hypothetical protein
MEILGSNKTTLWSGWHVLIVDRYSRAWAERYFKASLPISLFLFIVAVLANTFAGMYASDVASNSVTDIILSNIPAYDIGDLYVYGSIAFVSAVAVMLMLHPYRVPFVLSALALFYIIRAVFISLTHIGPYPEHAVLDFESKIILTLWGGGDQFFSGHTGTPFLLALVFWRDRAQRYFFLGASVFFATIVLLGHLHYTIDVASAFFITYAIYSIAGWMFPRERELFDASYAGIEKS